MQQTSLGVEEYQRVPREEYKNAKPLDHTPTAHATLWFDGLTFRLGDGNVPGILVRHGMVQIGCKALSVMALRELVKRLPEDAYGPGAVIQHSA